MANVQLLCWSPGCDAHLKTPSCSHSMPQLLCCCSTNVKEVLENDPGAYFVHDELLAPLKVMYNSLQETGDDSIANGRLLDAMRQVNSFCLYALFCLPAHCQLPWWDEDIQPYVHLKFTSTSSSNSPLRPPHAQHDKVDCRCNVLGWGW